MLVSRDPVMTRGRAARVRRRYDVSGLVQGVGFRPFVYATAADLGLAGSVANTSAGVKVEVEGDPASVEEFSRRLVTDAPPLAVVAAVKCAERPVAGGTGFTIEHSAVGAGRTLASPDVAICEDCLTELRDPGNRRYRHQFLAAGHLCSVMGTQEYPPMAQKYGVPIVVTGFEPLDILEGIRRTVVQLEEGRHELENAYPRVVPAEGNKAATAMLADVFEVTDRSGRGIGMMCSRA